MLLLVLAIAAVQISASVWLAKKAKGRRLIHQQSILLSRMAAFMAVSGGLELDVAGNLRLALEVLQVVLGWMLALGFSECVWTWSGRQTPRAVETGRAAMPLAVAAGVAFSLWGGANTDGTLWGFRWRVPALVLGSAPAAGVLIHAAVSVVPRMNRDRWRRELPWLLWSGLVLCKGLAVIVGQGTLLAKLAMFIDIPLLVLWARSAERSAPLELTVESVGTDSVRCLREALVLVDQNGIITYGNPAAQSLVQLDPRGRPLSELFPDWPCSGPSRLIAADDSEIAVVVSSAPLVISDEPVGLAVSATDVTDLQVALNQANTAREQANRAAAARQEFVAVMSHEVRTPMNAIVGLAHLLEDSHLGGVQADWARTLRRSADALLIVLNDILDFSRIESGRMELEKVPLSPGEVLRDAADLVENDAVRRGLQFTVDLHTLPEHVEGDPTRFRQVVLNLLSNAIKFTERGQVRLVAHHDATTEQLEVRVEDTGIGIPADRLPALFEAFTQADASTTRRFGGTGLGLAICKQLTSLMGGHLSVASTVGEGSVFTVRLPARVVQQPETDTASSTPEAAADLTQLRVLIVEDNPVNRTVLKAVLGRLGIVPDEAENGRQGVELVLSRSYDIVLMDLQMPVMDGFEALHQITATLGDARPHLVIHSAAVSRDDAERAISCGAHAHLPKPARPSTVEAVLRRSLEPDSSPHSPVVPVVDQTAEPPSGGPIGGEGPPTNLSWDNGATAARNG